MAGRRVPEVSGRLRLGDVIAAARTARPDAIPKTQRDRQAVAAAVAKLNVACSEGTLRAVEEGRRLPRLALVIALHHVLAPPHGQDDVDSLALWVALWLAESAAQTNSSREWDLLGARAAAVTERFVRAATDRRGPRRGRPTLADGIEAFEPLTIITGDRREWPARTKGDMFVSSPSPGTDMAFIGTLLTRLRGPAQLLSDKVLVVSREEYLRETLASHLLLIGAPSVNLGARIANPTAPFHFDVPSELQAWDKMIRENRQLDDARLRRLVWGLVRSVSDGAGVLDETKVQEMTAEHLDPELVTSALELTRQILTVAGPGLRSLTEITRQFHAPGIVDSVTARVHSNPRRNEDYALISLAPHPYSDEHVAIMVAGVHGYGTAHALRVLAERPEFFERRPLGAVLKLVRPEQDERPWAESLTTPSVLDPTDVTPSYSVADLLLRLRTTPSSDPVFANWSTEDLEATINFVSQYSGDDGSCSDHHRSSG